MLEAGTLDDSWIRVILKVSIIDLRAFSIKVDDRPTGIRIQFKPSLAKRLASSFVKKNSRNCHQYNVARSPYLIKKVIIVFLPESLQELSSNLELVTGVTAETLALLAHRLARRTHVMKFSMFTVVSAACPLVRTPSC